MSSRKPIARRLCELSRTAAAAMVLAVGATGAWASEEQGASPEVAATPLALDRPVKTIAIEEMTLEQFLDRLMIAESGGDDAARNPRSTALGAFQFIESTFLDVVARHFAEETAALSRTEILALRTDRAFARRAAEAFTRDNAAHLAGEGQPATFPNLRLAYLVGPHAAVRVLAADGTTPLSALLGPAALRANPFMQRLDAAGLVARCARELSVPVDAKSGLAVAAGAMPMPKAKPAIAVRCDLKRASCRHWLAVQKAKLAGKSGKHKQARR